jgi:hypothetical protein
MSPQNFPDFPDSPNPGGEGGGGDNVPYIDLTKAHLYFLSNPIIWDAGISNGHVRFRFSSDGPIMRYNIVWSRPGKEETDMRWVDPAKTSASEEYIINERPIPDTEYSFQVQAQGRDKKPQFNGPYNPYIYDYDRTPFVEKTFHTPPAPSRSDRATITDKHGSRTAPEHKHNPFSDRVDDTVRLIPRPGIKKIILGTLAFVAAGILAGRGTR